MSVQGSVTDNLDKSKNYSVGVVKGNDQVSGSASLFVNNYKDKQPEFLKPPAHNYSSAGAKVALDTAQGHSASLTATHFPNAGNQLTAAATANVLKTNDHRVDVNAFSQLTAPKGPHPSFGTHGGGVDYTFKEKVGIGASMAHTPMFKTTEQNIGAKFNLHQTPSSSLNLNVGASRTNTPFSQGSWQPGAFMGFKKQF